MHYLEDAVELLEYLPEELKKKCRDLQIVDAQSTVGLDKLLKDSHNFFANLKSLAPFESERKNKEFQEKYQTIRELGEGKVQSAEYLLLVLEKYQERIAKDLAEFKTELEVDNPGETELIEKNFMHSMASSSHLGDFDQLNQLLGDEIEQELDSFHSQTMPEQQSVDPKFPINGHRLCAETDGNPKQRIKPFDEFRIPANLRRPSQQMYNNRSSQASTSSSVFDEDIFDAEFTPPAKKLKPAPPPRTLLQTTVTPQREDFQKEGSVSSTSASSSTPNVLTPKTEVRHFEDADFAVPKQSPIVKMPLLAGSQASRHGRPRKLTKRVEQMLIGGTSRPGPPRANSLSGRNRYPIDANKKKQHKNEGQEEEFEDEDEGCSYQDEDEVEDEEEEGDGEEDADDNRTWCICKQKSHGKMVACDNRNCRFEWFHYECVGITQEPKGEWYCPTCRMQRSSARSSRSASSDLTH